MNTVISSLDKNYSLCDKRVTESKIILYIVSTQVMAYSYRQNWAFLMRLII